MSSGVAAVKTIEAPEGAPICRSLVASGHGVVRHVGPSVSLAAAVSLLGEAGIVAAESEVAQALAAHEGIAAALHALRERLELSADEYLATPNEDR